MRKLRKEKLWGKAKKLILEDKLLFSKRSEMFLPEYWPTYFNKAKALYVWDLKNKKNNKFNCKIKKFVCKAYYTRHETGLLIF